MCPRFKQGDLQFRKSEAGDLQSTPAALSLALLSRGELGGAAASGALSSSTSSMSKRPVRSALLEGRLFSVLPIPAIHPYNSATFGHASVGIA